MFRKHTRRAIVRTAVALLLGFILQRQGQAQLTSSTAAVALTATLSELLSISATPSSVTFTLVQGGVAVGSAPVAIHTTWLFLPTRANLFLNGYFASATAALTDGAATPDYIPASAVLGQMTTGSPTSYTAFTQNTVLGPVGAGLLLFTQSLTSLNRASSRTDNLSLEINLASLPQLPAGTYTGTLTLQAEAL